MKNGLLYVNNTQKSAIIPPDQTNNETRISSAEGFAMHLVELDRWIDGETINRILLTTVVHVCTTIFEHDTVRSYSTKTNPGVIR